VSDYARLGSEAIRAAKTRVERDIAAPGPGRAGNGLLRSRARDRGRDLRHPGRQRRNEITRDDLLAVTLLGVRWSPSAVRRLLGEDTARHCLLVGISTATSLWEASDNRLAAIDPLGDLPTRDSDGMG
jgi:Family of unknown function (DUF6308)